MDPHDTPPATTTTTSKKKPSLPLRSKHKPTISNSNSKTTNSHSTIRRSTRRNPIPEHSDEAEEPDEGDEEEEVEEEEDEREMKKQKLVQRLKSQPVHKLPSCDVSHSLSNGVNVDRIGGSETEDGSGNVPRVTDDACRALDEGSESSTPMPDKNIILFILDRLQKKDTQGAFSEPVDPEELPDYHEIIQNPMDFSTVRKKIDGGIYQNLEEFEDDIFLICSNAMEYNSPSTVFFRKAKVIQELAKRDINNLRQKGEDGEPQPRVIRRGRPPRIVEKSPEQVPTQNPIHESPVAALNLVSENYKAYNLRKGQSSGKFVTDYVQYLGADEPSCNETSVGLQEWNTEFPASILRAPYGKKPVVVDETRRETYRQQKVNPEMWATNMLISEPKRLLPVGLGMTEHYGYPSSLARFAAGLGPVAWKIALKKIKQSLPRGMEFDPLQFAYEGPKFLKYEVDVNLMPIFVKTGKSNSNLTQSFPNVNHEEAMDVQRPQNNVTRIDGVTVETPSLIKLELPERNMNGMSL